MLFVTRDSVCVLTRYLEGVKQAVASDTALALYLKKIGTGLSFRGAAVVVAVLTHARLPTAGRVQDAGRVYKRVKLMKQELANVDAAGGAEAVEAQRNA